MNLNKRVIIIDAVNQQLREAQVCSLEGCQAIVMGLIERGGILENGDEVFVNEEGLFGNPKHFFRVIGFENPLAGNAYITGPADDQGEMTDCKISLEEAAELISFLTIREF